ncbi:hypothetical protein Tsubulata_015714 [Turnera subulata]|uniref:Uncharacterized protein n=1 Tax=Turnera subulata TaxID=218843 RepID=A0A9Q0FDE4_9ROSI|nr:hypothetical protein Tsubulata_015714 [Turnera subulata]
MERCSVSSFSLLLLVVITLAFHSADATNRTLLFIFGDSTVDVGTNNFLEGSPGPVCPYGIDYPTNISTGRATNGYTLSDQLARRMGYEESPHPYLALVNSSSSFLNGVNFASGGSGIFDSTGWHFTIKQFSTVRDNITAELGTEEAARLLSQALFIVSDGGNDFFQYLLNGSISLEGAIKFRKELVQTYGEHFQELYKLGARKFGIVGIPPVASTPFLKAKLEPWQQSIINFVALRFYGGTKKLLEDLKLDGMKYSIANSFAFTFDLMNNPSKYNLTEVGEACWNTDFKGTDFTEDIGESCRNWNGPICPDRDHYLFFDPVHPTQRAADLTAEAFLYGETNYVEPINFSDLASTGIQYPTQKDAAEFGAFSFSGRKTKYVI